MPAYPGLLVPEFKTWQTHDEADKQRNYTPGTTFQIATYILGGNTGTYVDSPFHRYAGGPDLAGLPLDKLADLSGVLVHAAEDGPIGPESFANLELAGKAVLVRTDWSKRWGGDYFRSGPFLTADACQFLVEAGVTLVGIDCANIDNMTDSSRPAHTILLGANIPIAEHLCNLDQLEGEFQFFAVPPAIKGGTSFAVRAFAILSRD